MSFLQLTLILNEADPEPYEDALLAAGASSITLEDAADDPVLEPAPGETPLWPRVQIKALFDGDASPDVVLTLLRAQLPEPLPDVRFENIADRVWEREWLKDFRPMRFGQRLWICPGGQRPEVNGQNESDLQLPASSPQPAELASDLQPAASSLQPVFIDLDPGLAFGTGTHPTTALCLEWLEGADLNGKRVLDYGCGSGVLAIAALKLGAACALAVDIDPQALLATHANAERNRVLGRLTIQAAQDASITTVDVVLANILAGPLEQLASTFAPLVEAGGQIVLSGILHQQAAMVAKRYAPWFDIAPATQRDEWVRLNGLRRKS